MNAMDLFKAFGDVDENLVFDAIEGGAQPRKSRGAAPVGQPKNNRPRRGGAKTKAIAIGAVAAVLCAAIVCMALYFAGIFGGKQVPIYTGMEISSASVSASADGVSAVSYKYSGDHTGRSDNLDKNNPFGGGSSLEDEAASTLEVIGAGDDIYYADAGDDIYITIKFDNPDYYEIISFVLNDGTKDIPYSGTLAMFESGSDYENIIIKLNVGDTGGVIEYTISEIKYIDGTEIKNVTMQGDPVVKCGVRASDLTYAEISDEELTLTSISFKVNIVDKYSLISYSDGYVKAVLFNGTAIEQIVDLNVGLNTVLFDNLSSNTLYQFAVLGYYDALDGEGIALNYLYTDALYTPAVLLFDEDKVVIDYDSISFGYSWYDEVGTITSLTLTGGGTTQTLDAAATSVTGLQSYTEYTLTANYTLANGDSSSIVLEFLTDPEVEINSVSLRNSSVAVNKNGTIVLQLSANNPDGVTFNTVTVNGVEYAASSTSTDTVIYLNITVGDQFDVGLTTLTVTGVTYSIDGNTYATEVSLDPVTVFVNGELSVESLSVVRLDGGEYKEVDYAYAGETLYYAISLDNETEYDITSVTIDGAAYGSDNTEFSLSDDKQTVYVSFTCGGAGYVSANLSGLSYKNEYMNLASTKSTDLTAEYLVLTYSEVVEISSAEDIKNMTSTEFKYYKLMNDISLSGYTWVNVSNCMYGVFDGNGHTISGLDVFDNYEDADLYLGLFSYAEGSVVNLTMTDVNYDINLLSSQDVPDKYIYGGAIAATGKLTVRDCTITATIQANVSCKRTYIGGLVGMGSLDVLNSTVTSTLSISQTNNYGTTLEIADRCEAYVGGMIGSGDGSITGVTLNTNIVLEMYCKAASQGSHGATWYDAGYIGSIDGGWGYSIYDSEIECYLEATSDWSPLYIYLTSTQGDTALSNEISGSTITGTCVYSVAEGVNSALAQVYFRKTTDTITDSTISYTANGKQYTYSYGDGDFSDANGNQYTYNEEDGYFYDAYGNKYDSNGYLVQY